MKNLRSFIGLTIIVCVLRPGLSQSQETGAPELSRVPSRLEAAPQPALLKNGNVTIDDSRLSTAREPRKNTARNIGAVKSPGNTLSSAVPGRTPEVRIDELKPGSTREHYKSDTLRKQFDKNGDGKLDPAERAAMKAALQEKMNKAAPRSAAPSPAGNK